MPVQVRFRALTAKSKQIRTEALEAQVRAIQHRRLEAAKRVLTTYPPPIPTSKYVRTNKLRDSWHILPSQSNAGGITTILVSSGNAATHYVEFVEGDNQVAVHQGRWPVAREVIDHGAYVSELRTMMRGLIV